MILLITLATEKFKVALLTSLDENDFIGGLSWNAHVLLVLASLFFYLLLVCNRCKYISIAKNALNKLFHVPKDYIRVS